MSDDLGTCPFCRGWLAREGENLVCEKGDYVVVESRFDEIWDLFKELRPQATPETESVLVEKLLKDLREANIKHAT